MDVRAIVTGSMRLSTCALTLAVSAAQWGCVLAPTQPPRPDDPSAPVIRANPRELRPKVVGRFPLLIGRYCQDALNGRPGVMPVMSGGPPWTTDSSELAGAIAQRSARQFTVIGWRGQRAGLFSVIGAAAHNTQTLAVGSYVGAPPCHNREGEVISECQSLMNGCGVAVSRTEPAGGITAAPFEEDPDPFELSTVDACQQAGAIALDIDGDGAREVFPFPRRGADEMLAKRSTKSNCTGRFSGVLEGASGLAVLAAGDFDDDGRNEVLLSRKVNGGERWELYHPSQTAMRLEMVASAELEDL